MRPAEISWSVLPLLLVTISGCATGYHAMEPGLKGVQEGYAEDKLPDGTFVLRYSTAPPTRENEALELWHRRAKELCGSSDYKADTQVELRTRFVYDTSTYRNVRLDSPLVRGTLRCGKI